MVTEQPPPDLRDQIPESPVYEPPRYQRQGEARITEYATGEAAEGPGPFRLPWYLMGGTLVLIVLGAIISPARPVIGLMMIGFGVLFTIGAIFWTLSVCWDLGALWFFGAPFLPVVGLIALFRANNLRPLGLSVAASFMMAGGASLAIQARGAVKNVRPLTDEVTEIRDLSREEFIAECTKKEGALQCGCKTAALYDDELGQDVRLRVFNGRQTAADAARLNEAVRRNCKGSR